MPGPPGTQILLTGLRYGAHMPRRARSDYVSGADPDPLDFLLQVVVPSSPMSASQGDIVVTVLESGVDQWAGVWRLDTGEWDGEWRRLKQLGSCFGTRAELVRWAVTQDAATRWIFDEETSDFVPLG